MVSNGRNTHVTNMEERVACWLFDGIIQHISLISGKRKSVR